MEGVNKPVDRVKPGPVPQLSKQVPQRRRHRREAGVAQFGNLPPACRASLGAGRYRRLAAGGGWCRPPTCPGCDAARPHRVGRRCAGAAGPGGKMPPLSGTRDGCRYAGAPAGPGDSAASSRPTFKSAGEPAHSKGWHPVRRFLPTPGAVEGGCPPGRQSSGGGFACRRAWCSSRRVSGPRWNTALHQEGAATPGAPASSRPYQGTRCGSPPVGRRCAAASGPPEPPPLRARPKRKFSAAEYPNTACWGVAVEGTGAAPSTRPG